MVDDKVCRRMGYLIGHLKANLRMIEEEKYCVDVIRQNQAVISALGKVNEILLKNHLDTCVTRAIRGQSKEERMKVFQEIIDIFDEK